MKTLSVLLFSIFLTMPLTAHAGTGTCTAGAGATVDGGSCCTALGATGCTCNESGSSASGVVSCSASTIKNGSKAVVKSFIKPNNTLAAPGSGRKKLKLKATN